MEQAKILVSNIQRFSLHDGPGIRTTVFLKGCNACCPWCCNPENISKDIQGDYGRYYTTQELFDILMKDKNFYEGGGITFSGGEPLLQIEEISELLNLIKNESIHLAAETSLFCDRNQVEKAVEFFDLFYVDIKIAHKEKVKEVLKADFNLYLNNLKYLLEQDTPVIIRFPYISGFTDGENINDVINVLKTFNLNKVEKIEILKGHQLGKEKYLRINDRLNNFYSNEIKISDEDLDKIKIIFQDKLNNNIYIEVKNL